MPTRPKTSASSGYRLHRVLERNRLWQKAAGWLEKGSDRYRVFTSLEDRSKSALFGCRMCGQCALPSTAYACPMTCPKQLRNGPCGGVSRTGACEVYPDRRCVWVMAYERADETGHVDDLTRLQRPVDHRRWGQSSWVNYWSGRDEGLWTEDDGLVGEPRSILEGPLQPAGSSSPAPGSGRGGSKPS